MYLKEEKLGQSKLKTTLVPQFIILLLRCYCRKKGRVLSSNVTSKASTPWAKQRRFRGLLRDHRVPLRLILLVIWIWPWLIQEFDVIGL